MDRVKTQKFIRSAEADLASIRRSLLIIAQTSDTADLATTRRNLGRLEAGAMENGLARIVELTAECETAMAGLAESGECPSGAVYGVLDIVARVEAALFEIPLNSDEFLSDVSGFVDASFDELMPSIPEPDEPLWPDEEFEIDEETLDIFRTEADELLANIVRDLDVLTNLPGDQNALWDIRRNAHTFKGAAGIVGLKNAAAIAHLIEDLLDKMVELRRDAVPQVIEFLKAAALSLTLIVEAKPHDDAEEGLKARYEALVSWLTSNTDPDLREQKPADKPAATGSSLPDTAAEVRIDATRTASRPIVRVSLDRLDDLLKISRNLIVNRSALADRFAAFGKQVSDDAPAFGKLEALFETQRRLTDEMHEMLHRIRMVKFGTLETRLSRAVHVTSLDEGKKAIVELENGDVEIDTQIIDALIEPMLHLLKNAVVHGIEMPDTRRLIGKPERGVIVIRIEADDEALVLSISDDGGGISTQKLKEKAVANNLIDQALAESMTDREALRLIFDKGLTTAEKLDLNAGRGVGMSIVKESVESRGGTILVESEPQRGTTFTILLPLAVSNPKPAEPLHKKEDAQAGSSGLASLVLVVDDSASIRHKTARMVETAGYRTITANNGAEALELLLSGEWAPDLILSDVEMPQIDGWEFLEYAKADSNFGHIPVVLITSLDSDAYRQRAMDLGACDYIVKPIKNGDVERIFENLKMAAMV